MSVLPIVQYPNEILTTPTKEVSSFGEELQKIINDMVETHYAQTNCAALAANQLGFDLRITVIDFSENKNDLLILVNPYIVESSGETFTEEGCMSVQGISEKVKRFEKVKVKYQTREGEHKELEADGFLSKCIQHELDHLDGVVFLDRLSKLKKRMLKPKIARLMKN